MNSREILNAMNEIDEKYIEEAAPKTKKNTWKIWAGLAACICIFAVALTGVMGQSEKISVDDDPLAVIQLIEYNNAYYEVIESKNAREKNGFPEKITKDMAGEHIAYLETENGAVEGIYVESVSPTEIELYSYAPNPCDAVMILREENKYSVALFCNYISYDGNIKMEIPELYCLFGVNSAEDIASVTKTTWEKKGNKVTDRSAIADFFDITVSLESHDNDSFQTAVYGDKSEEEQQEISIDMAENAEYLCIETAGGLKFTLTVYPNYGWMYSSLTSYKMSEAMLEWYGENIE